VDEPRVRLSDPARDYCRCIACRLTMVATDDTRVTVRRGSRVHDVAHVGRLYLRPRGQSVPSVGVPKSGQGRCADFGWSWKWPVASGPPPSRPRSPVHTGCRGGVRPAPAPAYTTCCAMLGRPS